MASTLRSSETSVETESWVEGTPKRLSALHEARLRA